MILIQISLCFGCSSVSYTYVRPWFQLLNRNSVLVMQHWFRCCHSRYAYTIYSCFIVSYSVCACILSTHTTVAHRCSIHSFKSQSYVVPIWISNGIQNCKFAHRMRIIPIKIHCKGCALNQLISKLMNAFFSRSLCNHMYFTLYYIFCRRRVSRCNVQDKNMRVGEVSEKMELTQYKIQQTKRRKKSPHDVIILLEPVEQKAISPCVCLCMLIEVENVYGPVATVRPSVCWWMRDRARKRNKNSLPNEQTNEI